MKKISTSETWVIFAYGDNDISYIYLDKEEAEIDCIKRNDEIKLFRHINSIYKVVTLDDAISDIMNYCESKNNE